MSRSQGTSVVDVKRRVTVNTLTSTILSLLIMSKDTEATCENRHQSAATT